MELTREERKKRGAVVKALIKQAGFSQREFAEFVGLTEPYVSKLCNGKSKLSRALRLLIEYIIFIKTHYCRAVNDCPNIIKHKPGIFDE